MADSPIASDVLVRVVSLRALLAVEIAVSTLINIAFNFVFAWMLFPIGATIALWGKRGLALDTVPASFIPAVMMTFAISAIMRRRLRGGMRVSTNAALPIRLPRGMVTRSFVIGCLSIVLVAMPAVALLAVIWNDGWSWPHLIAFKLAFSAFHAAVVTPIIILSVLARARP